MMTHRHPDAAELADDVARLISDVWQLAPAARHRFLAATFKEWPKQMRRLAGPVMGRQGGRAKSPAKTEAVRKNGVKGGAKGGRPRKVRIDPQLVWLIGKTATAAVAPFLG